MTRLRNVSLCLTMAVWALLAPGMAGAAGSQESEHPAGPVWAHPVAALQHLVQDWLDGLCGRSEETEPPVTEIPAPGGETPSRITGSTEMHPDFDPNG